MPRETYFDASTEPFVVETFYDFGTTHYAYGATINEAFVSARATEDAFAEVSSPTTRFVWRRTDRIRQIGVGQYNVYVNEQ